MDSSTIQDFLEFISEEPSKNTKIEYLKEFLEDDHFRRVVEYAYNPFITFGQLKIKTDMVGIDNFDPDTWDILDALKTRFLTGNEAKEAIISELNRLNISSQILFKNILNKDLRAGFSSITVNKALPGTIPIQPYMRCSLPKEVNLEKFNWSMGVLSQRKADGTFSNVNVGTLLEVLTRQGQRYPKNFNPICSILKTLKKGYQYHGEFIVFEDSRMLPRKTSNGLMTSLLKGGSLPSDKGYFIKYYIWDAIPLEAVQTEMAYIEPYKDRFKMIQDTVKESAFVQPIETRIVHSYIEAQKHFDEEIEKGYEGTIFKDPFMPWKHGTSKWQVKLKNDKICELRVIGYIEGNGRLSSTFGSLVCASEDEDIVVNVSGFTDAERQQIVYENMWTNKIISVKFNEVIDDKDTGSLSLFLPRFDELREDKLIADSADRIVLM